MEKNIPKNIRFWGFLRQKCQQQGDDEILFELMLVLR